MIEARAIAEPALGVDFGTSNTVAVGRLEDGRVRPVLFDGSPVLPSAILADGLVRARQRSTWSTCAWLTGNDALHAAQSRPGSLEPYPKLRIDDGAVLLGNREVPVVDLFTTVLARVAAEATTFMGGMPHRIVLTHPAGWKTHRCAVLTAAADAAGLGRAQLISEPMAAAAYVADRFRAGTRPGENILIYDLGAGTFEVSIVCRTPNGNAVLASTGLTDTGGTDIDAALVAALLLTLPPDTVRAINHPTDDDGRRARWTLWRDVRTAKETLARTSSTTIYLPAAGRDLIITRDDLDRVAKPVIQRTLDATTALLREARLDPTDLAGIFLVGGTSRMPLVATALHRAFPIAPTVTEQPELVVAEGALLAATRHIAASATIRPPSQPPRPIPRSRPPAPSQPASVRPQPSRAAVHPAVPKQNPRRSTVIVGLALLLALAITTIAVTTIPFLPDGDFQGMGRPVRTTTGSPSFIAAVEPWRNTFGVPCEIITNDEPGQWRYQATCTNTGNPSTRTQIKIFEFDRPEDLRQFANSSGAGAYPIWTENPPVPPRSPRTPARYAETTTAPYNRHIIWVERGELILGALKVEYKDQAAFTNAHWDAIRTQWANYV